MEPGEAGRVVAYFRGASPEDLDRMGVDPARLPPAEEWTRRLEDVLRAPLGSAGSAYLAWVVDGEAVGFSSLKDLVPGESASMHLHMWSASHRGRGLGPVLFCLSALEAWDRFRLRSVVCEPSAGNPMPNRLLAKVGFPLEGTRVGASSDLSRVTLLNRYRVERAVAERFLAALG